MHLFTCLGLHFLVEWIEDHGETQDVLPAKCIKASKDILMLTSGDECAGIYQGHQYPVKVIASGKLHGVLVTTL